MSTASNRPEYYATRNPLIRGQMTYWRRDKKGRIKPWPNTVKLRDYLPTIDPWDAPEGVTGDGVREWMRKQDQQNARLLMSVVSLAVNSTGIASAAEFAVFSSRCCVCGRDLSDPESKVYGVGPDCRAGMHEEYLRLLAKRTAEVHAAELEHQRLTGAQA